MIGPGADARVLVATRPVDFRKGADSLAMLIKSEYGAEPFSGVVYVFRAKRADRIKLVWWDGTGLWRLEQGAFRWPTIRDGVMRLTAAQLGALSGRPGLAAGAWRASADRTATRWLTRCLGVDCALHAFGSSNLMLAEADLPDDIEALRALVLEQDRKLENADAEMARLKAMLDAFMRHRFGARSEKLNPDQLQLGLEDVETAVASAETANDAKSGTAATDRPRKRNRGALPAHLERIEQVVDVDSKECPCCGGALHQIGEDVAERLDVVPTTFRVLVTRRPRYGCRSCEGAVVQTPAPPRIVEGGLPTEALIAQVLVAKYADHLPLYRQAPIYARQGIQLDRSTLADWVGRAAWWLRPLRDHILAKLRRSKRLFAEETTAPVLDPGRGRTKTGQLWAYARDDRPWGGSDPPLVAYVYASDRKAERPETHPGEFAGVLQVDGYGGYAAFARRRQQVVLAFCWAHVRRKFYELAATSPVATEVLRQIALLYAVEDEVRGLPPERRRAARAERSRVIVDELRLDLDARLRQVSSKSRLAEAIRYALTRWDGLSRFLDDGRIDLDSNTVERSIRPLALNRKNALFAGSDEGGDNWAVIATLIDVCKLNGVNPHTWLTATLSKLAAGHPAKQLAELMPWNDVG